MRDFKQQIRKFISDSDLKSAADLMEKNGITISVSLKQRIDSDEKRSKSKTKFKGKEYEQYLDEFEAIAKELLQLI